MDSVWRALSNPVRRRILDLLRDGPRTTGEVAEKFGDLSRFAVMQHLRVLEQASLVLVRREGRTRLNYLNAVPVREIYERWVSRLAGGRAEGLVALKKYVERKGMMDNVRSVKIEDEIRVSASLQKVWAAMTTEQLEWYPHTYGRDRVKGLVFEEKVGGRMYEDWGDGAGTLYGTITYFDPPKALGTRGYLKGGILLEQWLTLEEDGEQVVIQGSTTCFGEITDETEQGIRLHGTIANYEKELRAYVEA